MRSNSLKVTSDSAQKAVYYVSTFYKFQKDSAPEATQRFLEDRAHSLNIRGLIIIGAEGFNATVCAKTTQSLEDFKKEIKQFFNCPDLFFKDSTSSVLPFRRFKVKIRPEIVTLGETDLVPYDLDAKNHHLIPSEWNQVMKNEKPVLIDTRNWYETKIGTFKGALNPQTDQFREFPQYLEKNNIPKDQKILIFCTGGIRCEKGILEMQQQGYKNVYQLYGGILNYLQEYPNDQFEGECFVFDHRVAVDQSLRPTEIYKLCPHCGQPGTTALSCSRCDTPAVICEDCAQVEYKNKTCSKNCAHHFELHPERKAPRQVQPYEGEEW